MGVPYTAPYMAEVADFKHVTISRQPWDIPFEHPMGQHPRDPMHAFPARLSGWPGYSLDSISMMVPATGPFQTVVGPKIHLFGVFF